MKAGYGYIIGRRHAEDADETMRICQDFADSYVDDDIAVIAVADGKAGRNLPAAAVAAARANVETVIAFFRDPATWHIKDKNKFKETLLRMFDTALENAAGRGEFKYEELRATVSAVAINANGEYLAVSVGDGAIVAFDTEMNPKVRVSPYREGPKNRTIFTNEPENAREHMAIRGGFLKKSQYVAFAVFTDGADSLVRRMADGADLLRTAAACTMLGSGDKIIDKIISNISTNYSRDDVSLAVLATDTPEASEVAKKLLLERQTKMQDEDLTEETAAEQEVLAEVTQDAPAEEEEVLLPPPAPEVPDEEQPPVAEEVPAPAEVPAAEESTPTPCEATILRAVFAEPKTAQELVESGHIRKGRVLENVLPLIRENRIRYEDGRFYGNE